MKNKPTLLFPGLLDQDLQAKHSGIEGFNRKKWVGKEDLSYPIVDP